jgi:hypothetical protein
VRVVSVDHPLITDSVRVAGSRAVLDHCRERNAFGRTVYERTVSALNELPCAVRPNRNTRRVYVALRVSALVAEAGGLVVREWPRGYGGEGDRFAGIMANVAPEKARVFEM